MILSKVYGYLGVGISEYTGEILLFDNKTDVTKLEEASLILMMYLEIHTPYQNSLIGGY